MGLTVRGPVDHARRSPSSVERQPASDRDSRQTRPDRERPPRRQVSPGQPVAERSHTRRNCSRRRDTVRTEFARHSEHWWPHRPSSHGDGSNPNGNLPQGMRSWSYRQTAASGAAVGERARRSPRRQAGPAPRPLLRCEPLRKTLLSPKRQQTRSDSSTRTRPILLEELCGNNEVFFICTSHPRSVIKAMRQSARGRVAHEESRRRMSAAQRARHASLPKVGRDRTNSEVHRGSERVTFSPSGLSGGLAASALLGTLGKSK